MEGFFNEYLPGKYTFCDMAVNRTCVQLFATLINITGTPPSIPTIIVTNNGSVVAIVLGELENSTFWSSLLSGAGGGNESVIPVYSTTSNGVKIIGYVPRQYENSILKVIMETGNRSGSGVTTPRGNTRNVSNPVSLNTNKYRLNPILGKGVLAFLLISIAYVVTVESGLLERVK